MTLHKYPGFSAIFLFSFMHILCFQCIPQEILLDYNGFEYQTVRIGMQVWMAENLRSTHDARGNKINRICHHHKQENCINHGALYAWDDLNIKAGDSSLQGICPDGWHIPSDKEWQTLIDEIGGADSASYKLNKEMIEGFSLQHGGNYHSRLENFNFLGKNDYFWTAMGYSSTAAWIWMFAYHHLNANRSTVPKVYCLSVRCVKD